MIASIKINLFCVFFFLIGCTTNIQLQDNLSKNYYNSNYGKYLSASYSVKNGDVKHASEILTTSTKYNQEITLIELAFYSKIINGQFLKAKTLSKKYKNILDKNSFANIPLIALHLKNNELEEASKLIDISDDLPGFDLLAGKVKNLILISKKTTFVNEEIKQIKKNDIFDLITFETFENKDKLTNELLKQNQTVINKFLLFGYLKRKKLLLKKINLVEKILPFNFQADFLNEHFLNKNNLFLRTPNSKLIISSYFVNLSNHLSQKNNIPSSYIKMLLEISYFIYPELSISNYYLSEIYEDEKNYNIALNKLNLIFKHSPIYVPSLIKKYNVSKKINSNKAKIYLKELQNNYYSYINVKYQLADNYRLNKNCSKALKIYDEILKETSNDVNFLFYKASCLEKIGLWKEAKTLFFNIIKLNENDAYSLNYLSYSMAIRNEDLEKANILIDRALKIEPNNGFFLDTLGWIQFKKKRYNLAIYNLQRAIVLQPNSSEIMDHLGDCYLKTGRIKEAVFEWKRALKYDASDKLKKNINIKLKKYE